MVAYVRRVDEVYGGSSREQSVKEGKMSMQESNAFRYKHECLQCVQ